MLGGSSVPDARRVRSERMVIPALVQKLCHTPVPSDTSRYSLREHQYWLASAVLTLGSTGGQAQY
eukprot:2978491-Rhodomonas_salina.1